MAEVTREMILDYMIRKGGVVKNVDLVRHFRKFLQLDEPLLKDRAREIFKERVNAVAYIKAEKGEKYLYLKQEFHPAGGLHRPPTGRLANEKLSTSSIEDNRKVVNQRDSVSSLLSSSSVPSRKSSSSSLQLGDRTGIHVAGASHKQSDAVLHSYRPLATHTTTISSPPPLSSSPFSPPPPPSSSSSPFSPPPPISSSPLFSSPPPPKTSGSMFSPPPGQSGGPAQDDGESLLAQMTAELSSFGSFFSSFGPTSSLAGGSPLEPARSNPPATSGSSRPPPPRVPAHSPSSTLTALSSSSTASSSVTLVNSTPDPMNKSPLTVRHSLGDAPTTSTFGAQKSADAPTTSTFEPRRPGNVPTAAITEPRKLNDAPTFEPRRPNNGPQTSSFKPHRGDDVPTTSTFEPWRVDDTPTMSTFQPQRLSDTPTSSSFEPQRPGQRVESPTAPNPRQGTPSLEPRMEKRTLGPSVELPPEFRPLGHSPTPTEVRKLGPPVEIPPSSPTRRQGPSVDHLAMNGIHSHPHGGATRAGRRHDAPRRQGSMDGTRRQGSFDRTHSPLLSPAIRIESPTRSPDSANGVGSSSVSPVLARDRTYTSVAPNGSIANSLGVQLRRDSRDKPPDGKVSRSQSSASAMRRSRNLDKNFNLDSITRSSIMMTPPAARRKFPPMVAPKPHKEQAAARSLQDIAHEGDDEGSIAAISDQAEGEYYEIDPLEKEWMVAATQADMESIHRLIMTDPSLINRRDFIQYTALHWAAKHGRCDIISGLVINGAYVDLKSNGFTPLHLAALAGHDNVIKLLVEEYGASVNIREHSGNRPITILNKKASDHSRVLLSLINNYGLPTRSGQSFDNLATFSRSHKKKSSLERPWGSVGQLYDRRVDPEKLAKRRLSPRLSIRKSLSFRTRKKEHLPKREKGNKRPRSSARPDNWDV